MKKLLSAFVLSMGIAFTGSMFTLLADEGETEDDDAIKIEQTDESDDKGKADAKKDAKVKSEVKAGANKDAEAAPAPAVAKKPEAPAKEAKKAPAKVEKPAQPEAAEEQSEESEKDADVAVEEKAEVVEEKVPPAAAPAAPAPDAKPAPAAQQAGDAAGEKKDEAAAPKKKFCLCRAAVYYFPNLFKDLSEVFSVQAGAGPVWATRFTMTKWAQLGLDYGDSYFLAAGYEGQYGGGESYGWEATAACIQGEKRLVNQTFGSVKPYSISERKELVPSREEEVYKNRIKDFWSLGVKVAWFLALDLEMHPDEFADFLAGIFFVDVKGDNW